MQEYPSNPQSSQQPQFPQSSGDYAPPPGWQPQATPPPPPPSGNYAPPPGWSAQATPPPPYATMPGQMPNWQAGPPQQPRKSRKKLWITLGVILLLVIIIGAVASNGNKSGTASPQPTTSANSAPTQASQPTTAPTQANSGTHKIGETVTIDNWDAVVNSAKISTGGQFDTPQHSGDVFLEISVSVTNNTGKAQTFSSLLSFTLKDSSGQKYDETIVTDAPSTPDGNVAAGGKLKGTISYEVPKDTKSFELDFSPDPFGSTDVAVWTFTV